MKVCNCRYCGREFTVAKPMPFCCGSCRTTYKLMQTRKQTIQVGVINDNSNTEKD